MFVLLATAGTALTCDTFSMTMSGLSNGQVVEGLLANVQAVPRSISTIDRVEFRLDGTLIHTERIAPYCVGDDNGVPTDPCYLWDTRRFANGPHTLRATAFDATGHSASTSTAFTIQNFTVVITGLSAGQVVSGSLANVQAVPGGGGTIDRVEFRLDGALIQTERIAPYCVGDDNGVPTDPCYLWDTRRFPDGPHTLLAAAFNAAARSASTSVSFVIGNSAVSPSPTPTPTPAPGPTPTPAPGPTPTPTPSPTPVPSVSTLLWKAPTSGPVVSLYKVYIATDSGGTDYALRGSTSGLQIPLSSLGLAPGRLYWARITSVGVEAPGLESPPSSAISFAY